MRYSVVMHPIIFYCPLTSCRESAKWAAVLVKHMFEAEREAS